MSIGLGGGPILHFRRLGLCAVASLGVLAGTIAVAHAAPANNEGCISVNAGLFNFSASHMPSHRAASVSGFSTGDVITFVISGSSVNAGSASQWWITDTTGLVADHSFTADGSLTKTQAISAAGGGSINQVLRVQNGAPVGQALSVTATCVAAPPPPPPAPTGPTESDKLSGVQIGGTRQVASVSASAISASVFGAISGAFSPDGSTLAMGPNGITMNFYVAPANDGSSALQAIGGADDSALAPAQDINIWANIRGSGIVRINPSAADLNGAQINVTAGLGYRLLPDLTIGAFTGYESFGYDFKSLSGRLDGRGGTVGAYAGWLLAPNLRWDVLGGWSALSYDANSGGASGHFSGSRWLASTALTGQFELGDFTIEPTINAQGIWEHQQAWTDSLGGAQAARDAASGRIALGGRVMAPSTDLGDLTITPYVGFYGDWHFAGTDALPSGVDEIGLAKGWSGRIIGGVDLVSSGAGSLGLSGEYGGLGSDYGRWTANARAGWSF